MIHLSKPIECTTPGVIPNVDDGLWVIITYQNRLMKLNNLTWFRRGHACVRAGDTWKLFFFFGLIWM
jgi:hypothetical protein